MTFSVSLSVWFEIFWYCRFSNFSLVRFSLFHFLAILLFIVTVLIFIVVPFADVFHFVHLTSDSILLGCFSLELFLAMCHNLQEQQPFATSVFVHGTVQFLIRVTPLTFLPLQVQISFCCCRFQWPSSLSAEHPVSSFVEHFNIFFKSADNTLEQSRHDEFIMHTANEPCCDIGYLHVVRQRTWMRWSWPQFSKVRYPVFQPWCCSSSCTLSCTSWVFRIFAFVTPRFSRCRVPSGLHVLQCSCASFFSAPHFFSFQFVLLRFPFFLSFSDVRFQFSRRCSSSCFESCWLQFSAPVLVAVPFEKGQQGVRLSIPDSLRPPGSSFLLSRLDLYAHVRPRSSFELFLVPSCFYYLAVVDDKFFIQWY